MKKLLSSLLLLFLYSLVFAQDFESDQLYVYVQDAIAIPRIEIEGDRTIISCSIY